MEGEHDNDNEELSFVSLAALTANVVRYLEPEKDQREQREREPDTGNRDEQKGRQHEEYVKDRLRELRAFESRYRLGKNRP